MQSLLAALRSAMPPAVWSRGVNLCREGRVNFVHPGRLAEDEVEAQVRGAPGGVATAVVLYPDDDDWSCDCSQAACAHAAAAAIALGQARAGRLPEPAAHARPLHLRHALIRTEGGLGLRRELFCPEARRTPEPLAVPLAVRQRQPGAPVVAQASDVAIDALLAGRRIEGALGAALLARVLASLVDADHVTLDGAPVRVGEPTMALRARALAQPGGGILLRGDDPAGLDERFANGAGRFGATLKTLVQPQLSERDQAALRRGQYFAPSQLPTLMGDVLPRLRRHVPVAQEALGAIDTVRVPARLCLHVRGAKDAAHTPEGASVVAQIVYGAPGAPPVGRVVGDRLEASGKAVPLRDAPAEARLQARLAQALQLQVGEARVLAGARAIPEVQALLAWAQENDVELNDPAGALESWRLHPALALRWRGPATLGAAATPLAADALDALALYADDDGGPGTPALDEDGARSRTGGANAAGVSLEAAFAAHARGEDYLALPGGGFAPVPGPLLAQHAGPLRALLQARAVARAEADGGKLPRWSLSALGELGAALALPVPAAARAAWASLAQTAADAESGAHVNLADATPPGGTDVGGDATPSAGAPIARVSPPADVVLRPYQRTGIAWLRARAAAGVGALLADDMGLGKTLQTLLALGGRVLVVAPTSVLGNWAAEAARFRPDCTVHTYHGTGRKRADLMAANWVLTSYGVLRLEADALAQAGFDAVVLDEAHTIKRAGSQVAQAAYRVGQSTRFRLALTGTPLENRSEELWSLLHFLNPGWLGPLSDFTRDVARPLQQGDEAAAAGLRQRVRPVLLRRLKREVARDLPPRTDVVLRNALTPAERNVYAALAHATRQEVVARLMAGESVMAALEALLRLRQAACDVGLLPGHAGAPPSSKLLLLLNVLQQGLGEGHRALVFSQWTGLLDRLEPLLQGAGIAFARLDGSTPNRHEVVRTFADEAGPPVLLMSLKAGGVGLNLTAADHVFLLDPWWNPAAEDQAADRANRIGQTRPVLVHRLISDETVEEAILALQGEKRRLAEAALSGEGAPSARGPGLTREDLLAVLA